MKKLLYLTVLITVISCNDEVKNEIANPPKRSKFKTFHTKFKDIAFDTLNVYSGELDKKNYKFKGRKLDSANISMFEPNVTNQEGVDLGYYACYKFQIDKNRTGFITRTPSEYESSSVKLLILDKQKDAITTTIELAETWGDAGDSYDKSSWIFKTNNKYNALIWVRETHDHSVDDPKDTTYESNNEYYLLDISKAKADTISSNEKELKKKFNRLLK